MCCFKGLVSAYFELKGDGYFYLICGLAEVTKLDLSARRPLPPTRKSGVLTLLQPKERPKAPFSTPGVCNRRLGPWRPASRGTTSCHRHGSVKFWNLHFCLVSLFLLGVFGAYSFLLLDSSCFYFPLNCFSFVCSVFNLTFVLGFLLFFFFVD